LKKISSREIEAAFLSALDNGQIREEDTAVIFYSTAILKDRLQLLQHHFPADTLHAVAVKTNSSPEVLQAISSEGFGLEAASLEEVILAVEAGVSPEKIVFDSPVKTRREIAYCHQHLPGITLNANSIAELERYPKAFSGHIGLRVNPLIEADVPEILNVAKKASKFGVPFSRKEEIIKACLLYPEITGLHVHIGSGIKKYDANILAVKKITELAREINLRRSAAGLSQHIGWIDIGGGIDFEAESGPCSLADFVAQLRLSTSLFEDFRVITEFGKYVHQDASFVVSDIEYIEQPDEKLPPIAYIHVGADLFVRKVYSGLPIHYPCSVIKGKGNTKTETMEYTIAGPLCFAGDIVFDRISLPCLEPGDKLAIQAIGANTLSMWSKHCNRKVPGLILLG